jgi:predicted pyridoxine 5'-phosphate oxidase superfamily flavin-nucleotide-binding protein
VKTPSDHAFTPSVKAAQVRFGSRAAYARVEAGGGWPTALTKDVQRFITAQTSFFLATASVEGQPYIQHRGGPVGFVQVLDARTLAFADLRGNGQYISVGNLAENPRVHAFFIDYARRQRVKVWAEGSVVEDDEALLTRLAPAGKARAERAFVLRVLTWDVNCPQHIPQRFDAADGTRLLEEKDRRIAELEAAVRGESASSWRTAKP